MYLIQADSMLATHCYIDCNQIQRLQKVQNWAARFIDGAMKYSHATPQPMQLHWPPIAVQVEFKILLFTDGAPGYVEQCVSRLQPVWSLRSSEH